MTQRTDVSVLYVDARGPYPKLVADWWNEARDANRYGFSGRNPVVAHPPCSPWSRMKHLAKPGARLDAAAQCGPVAVGFVRTFGGVLEQPASSALWRIGLGLPLPGELPDYAEGFTVEVEQVNWGHPARKRTWLYCVGIDREFVIRGIRTGAKPTHWASGSRGKSSRQGSPVPPGIKVCSAQQRNRTPVAFAKWLLDLAASAGTCACSTLEFAHKPGCRFWPNARTA